MVQLVDELQQASQALVIPTLDLSHMCDVTTAGRDHNITCGVQGCRSMFIALQSWKAWTRPSLAAHGPAKRTQWPPAVRGSRAGHAKRASMPSEGALRLSERETYVEVLSIGVWSSIMLAER